MASSLLRSRVSSIVSRSKKPNRRTFSSNVDKESIISSQSIITDQAAEATAAAAESSAEAAAAAASSDRKGWSLFKYGLIATLTGATGFAGYATYGWS